VKNTYDYLPFGGAHQPGTSVTVEQRYTYTGREKNPESALMYYRYRQYDSRVGRFGGRDPIGYVGGVNVYAYVMNRPLDYRDSMGLICEDCCSPEGATRNVRADRLILRPALRRHSPGVQEGMQDALTAVEAAAALEAAANIAASAAQGMADAATQIANEYAEEGAAYGYTDAMRDRIEEIAGKITTQEGVRLWVLVTGECCRCESCWVVFSRLNWQEHEYWHGCSASGPSSLSGIGFAADDTRGIAQAMMGCFAEGVENFDCDRDSNASDL
jgi:RHS repeat-associated protein